MKYLYYGILIIFIFLIFSCQQKKNKESNEGIFDWITGDWKRKNEQEGKSTYEYWHKKSNQEYLGLGVCRTY